MNKINTFLSSAMTGELDKEREMVRYLFSKDSTLKEFYNLYAIEEHSSPRTIENAFISEVDDSDLVIFIFGNELRNAVLTEYETAIKAKKRVLCYINKYPKKQTKRLKDFIDDELYRYHPAHYIDGNDLCERIKNDLQDDLLRSYIKTIKHSVNPEESNYIKTTTSTADSFYRFFPLDELLSASKNDTISSLTVDQLLSLSIALIDNSGDYKFALLLLEIGILKEPENWILYNNHGILLETMGLPNIAIFSYRKAIENNPNSDTAYYNYGNIIFDRAEFKEALPYYQKALEIEPNKYNALSRISACYINLDDKENSILWAKKAYSVLKDDVAITNLALALALNGKFKESHKTIDKINEKNIQYKKNKAYIFKKEKKFQKAIDIVDELFESGFLEYGIAKTKLDCLVELGEKKEVEHWINELEKRFPISASDYNNFGFHLMEKFGHYEYLNSLFLKAIELDPKLMSSWHSLQANLGALGDNEKGLEKCNQALRIEPYNPKNIHNKMIFLQEMGKYDELVNFIFEKSFGVFGNDQNTENAGSLVDTVLGKSSSQIKEMYKTLLKLYSNKN